MDQCLSEKGDWKQLCAEIALSEENKRMEGNSEAIEDAQDAVKEVEDGDISEKEAEDNTPKEQLWRLLQGDQAGENVEESDGQGRVFVDAEGADLVSANSKF